MAGVGYWGKQAGPREWAARWEQAGPREWAARRVAHVGARLGLGSTTHWARVGLEVTWLGPGDGSMDLAMGGYHFGENERAFIGVWPASLGERGPATWLFLWARFLICV